MDSWLRLNRVHRGCHGFENALAFYTEIIKLYPKWAAGYIERASCYIQLGKHGEALNDAKTSININPMFIKAYVIVIKCSLIVGDILEAKSALNQAFEIDHTDRSILAEQRHLEYVEKFWKEAEVAYTERNFRKAVYCIDRCCEVSTLCPAFKQRKAECLKLLDEEVRDIALLVDALNECANEHYNAKKYTDALADYTEIIKLCPAAAKHYSNRAACYMMLGKYHEALTDAKKCISIDPKFIKAYSRVIKCSLMLGMICEARSAVNEALKLQSNNRNILASRQLLEHVEKFSNEAEVAYAKKDYSRAAYCMDLCCKVSKLGQYFKLRKAECLKLLDQEKIQKVKLARVKHGIANQHYKAKRYTEALAAYTEVIAACYTMLGEYHEALSDAKHCIDIDPTFIKAYARVMKCFLILGDIPEAKSALRKAIKLDPRNSCILAEQKHLQDLEKFSEEAEVAFAKGDYERVVNCMDRCCIVSTSCPAFKLRKAEALIFMRKFAEAQGIVNDISQMDKLNVDSIYVSGMCLYYQDNMDKALEQFRELFRLASDYTKAMDLYKKAKTLYRKKEEGNTAFKMGNYTEAFDLYTEALTIDPDHSVANAKLHFNRALTYDKLNKCKESVIECTEALKLNKNYLKALLKRADCYTRLRNFQAAVCDYEEACKIDATRENERLLHEAELALEKCARKNYYKILGIEKNATTDDIKQAYRKKALAHHPDKHTTASSVEQKQQERKFKLADEAYKVLSDAQKRKNRYLPR